jgi:hypothetical protein
MYKDLTPCDAFPACVPMQPHAHAPVVAVATARLFSRIKIVNQPDTQAFRRD